MTRAGNSAGQGPRNRGRGSKGEGDRGAREGRGESDPLPRRGRAKGTRGGTRRCSSLQRGEGVAEEVARIRRDIQAAKEERESARASWEATLRESRRIAQRWSHLRGKTTGVLANIGIKEEPDTDDEMEDAESSAQGGEETGRSLTVAARNPTLSLLQIEYTDE